MLHLNTLGPYPEETRDTHNLIVLLPRFLAAFAPMVAASAMNPASVVLPPLFAGRSTLCGEGTQMSTVSSRDFNLQNFKLSASNPRTSFPRSACMQACARIRAAEMSSCKVLVVEALSCAANRSLQASKIPAVHTARFEFGANVVIRVLSYCLSFLIRQIIRKDLQVELSPMRNEPN